LPITVADELVEWLQATLAIAIYIVCVLTSPLTFPVLALCVMLSSKKRILRNYGADNLTEVNE
jgi:hypothetical protein